MKIESFYHLFFIAFISAFLTSEMCLSSSFASSTEAENSRINELRACASEPAFLRLLNQIWKKDDLARGLIIASGRNFLATMKYLIERRGVPVNTRVDEGYLNMTALMAAVDSQNTRIVIYLVESAGAQVDHDTSIGSPLVNAAADGNVELVKYLAAKGANVERTDSTHRSSVYAAISEEQVETAIALIKMGAFFALTTVGCDHPGFISQICNGLLDCLLSHEFAQRHICYRLYNQYCSLTSVPRWYGEEEHDAFQYLVYLCNPCHIAKRREIRDGIRELHSYCMEHGLGEDIANLICTKFLVMPVQEGFQYEFDSRLRRSSSFDSRPSKRQRIA